jgi:MFS family permease
MMLWGIGGIFGYACFGFIADLIGRRPTVALYNIGTLVLGLTLFLAVDSMAPFPYLLVVYGFFVLGVFSGHAVYIPELFPTHVRATAVPFCNGTARVITSFGPLVGGPSGRPLWREFQQTRGHHDLLCLAQHLRNASRPRDQGGPVAALGSRQNTGSDWR